MFPEPTELLLIGCLIESIWTPRSKSNTLTPRTNSQTYWQREGSHVMNGIIFCFCPTSAISVPPNVLKWCRKEHNKMQERKSHSKIKNRWWIWPRDTAQGIRTCLPRLHRKARGKPNLKVKYLWLRGMSSNQEQGDLWWALAHQTTQNGTLTTNGLLKSGNLVKSWEQERGRPADDKFVTGHDMDSDIAAESNLSLKSRSFLHRVNDRLRKILEHLPEVAMQDIDKRSLIWWMFYVFNIGSICIHGKELLRNFTFHQKIQERISLWNRCFDISEKFIVGQSDEIFGVTQINWEDSSWRQLSLVNDEEVISLSHAKVYVFSDSVLCLGKVNQNPTSNTVREEKLSWSKDSSQYRTLDTIDGEPMELEWNIFPGFTTLQFIGKVQEIMTKIGDTSQFKGRIIFMSTFNDIVWGSEDNERECIANATTCDFICKKISSRTLVLRRTWIRKEVVFYLHW